MRPSTLFAVKYQCTLAAIALGLAAIQWHKSGWRSALFIFCWVFALLNLPVAWYAGKQALSNWWRARKRPWVFGRLTRPSSGPSISYAACRLLMSNV